MNKDYFVIVIVILSMISIVGYVHTTSSFSNYVFGEILNKAVLNQDDGGSIQKSKTISEISEDKIMDNDTTSQFKRAPEFQKIEGSINTNDSAPISLVSLKGKVVLVNFWTYSCINVLRTLPHLIDWDTKYSDSGLVIVGIHTPEFEFEKNTDNVKSAVHKYGIKYPVLQDNAYGTWNAYENNYWPRMYLIDAQGYVRYDKIGESDYGHTEKVIQSLLNELDTNKDIKNTDNDIFSYYTNSNIIQNTYKNNVSSFLAQPIDFSKIKTPELYFGNQSSRSAIGNPEGLHLGQAINYFLPSSSLTSNSSIKPNTIYLEGQWKNNPDNVELQSNTGRILLSYSAKSVNMVVGVNSSDNSQNQSQVTIYEDNSLISDKSKGIDVKNNSKFTIDEPRLYNIVNHQSYSSDNRTLLVDIKGKGFQAYVFTFG
ncbi:redoxin domain-containing protein [Candidatus Nitrosocosmicus arcticus]|uniref:Thiol-disulfide isomerase or thioredoxin n=1 Tax=Candidatus Nitrosocosmicus arcticus TaxID=2035267 RepID=A0A557SV21_9ARCH|nr:redoxin domain-containing protein [Candidatus Nitrosocosmicus arcticus]TVP40431.1 Thiol-disulfide isomerase or thioredoxin [Candidatus Nitrosocosmicus arcticus]